MEQFLKDRDCLLEKFTDQTQLEKFHHLERCFSEQTIGKGNARRVKTKEDGRITSGMLQSPEDPDATYRQKAGKEQRGYVENIEELLGEDGSVIMDYQFEPNNGSDSHMLNDHLDQQ